MDILNKRNGATPFTKYCLVGAYFLSSLNLFAIDSDTGSTSSSLDTAIEAVNLGNSTLNFNSSVSLTNQVRALNADFSFLFVGNTITVTGNTNTLNGNSTTRGFFVGGESSSSTGSVTINNLIFNNCNAQGGTSGGASAGGGMGAGGGLFVGRDTVVVLENCSFTNCSANGGNTGVAPAGDFGGGGMSGDALASGGGGYGGDGDTAGGGCSGFANGDASGVTPGNRFTGTGAAGTRGVGGAPDGGGGFGGGGGGGGVAGGPGGFGGGGGASPTGVPAAGGFGGGGASRGLGAIGAAGGFGAGGGAGIPLGAGGFGGGDGSSSVATGGRGAGFGGAIFMEPGSDLTILGSATFSGNTATAGSMGNANTDASAGFGSLGDDIFMMSSSSLTFNITSDVIMPSPIKGDIGAGGGDQTMGGLTKSGSALLTLTGDNTYTGITRVTAGELRVTSTISTETIVEAGAVISGNFTIAALGTNPLSGSLTNSGTVSPGVNGVGTITIDRDYTQTGTGTFLVDITPDGISDRLFLTAGNAMLDGTLNIIVNQGNYIAGTQYEIINAPTNGTQFATVVQSGALAGRLDIQVDYSSVVLTILNTLVFVDIFIAPGVPSAVSECFTSVTITPGSDFSTVAELLGILDSSALNKALPSLSPVQFGALEWINERNNSYVADLLSQHLFELCCSPRDCCSCDCDSSFWINVFGNIMDNTKQLDNLRRFDANAVGALAGVDFCCGPCFYYGASVGYTHTHLIWRDQGGKGNLDSYYGALYGSWRCDCFSADVSVIGGGTDQDLERRIVFTGLDRVAKSDPWGYFVTGHLGLRSMWDWCYTTFEPYAVGDYHYYTRQSFKEKGADSINLNVRSEDQHFIRGEAGLKVYSNAMNNCYCLAPYIGLSWVGEFPLHASKQKATFINQDCVMDVESYDSSVQLASPQGGVKWTCCNGASLTLGYKGLFNNKTRINQVEGRFEWIF